MVLNNPSKCLDSILSSEKLDLVVIQESKIGADTPDASFNYSSCQIIRRDRMLCASGLLLFIKKSYKLILSYIDAIFETIALTLVVNNLNFNLSSNYNPHF